MIKKSSIKYVSALDAAQFLGVTPQTVRKWIAVGKLKPKANNRKILIKEADLQIFKASYCKLPSESTA